MDLTIFGREYDECTSINNCTSIQKLLSAVTYYSSLDIINIISHREILNNFMDEVYSTLIDDYIHLINNHANELNEIELCTYQCDDIQNCSFTARHHRNDRMEKIKPELDPTLNFYKITMDSVHFYLFHLYQSGLRTLQSDNDYNQINDDGKYFDKAFDRLSTQIDERGNITKSFERFQSNTNNKFNIMTNHNHIDTTRNTRDDDIDHGITYLDAMYQQLLTVGIINSAFNQLKQFINSEDFDSDSIKADFDNGSNNGNIACHIKHERCIEEMVNFVKKMNMSSSSFSIGFRFYYWRYYETLKQIPVEDQETHNMNDHSGYDVCDLFVKPKYSSFKEEIAHYKYITFQQYQSGVVTKINYYMNTEVVRSIKANVMYCQHYDVVEGTGLGFNNLLSLILYTDYSNLSTHFSSTFRRKTTYETLESVKKRNSKYWWMSKILRETVEAFGGCSRNGTLLGPFYCGMSVVMNMPSFNIRLCSPTSTSMKLEVAIKFSGHDGIVIQLNNPNSDQCKHLTGFNCSWISRYKEEDERLFFGGDHFIQIESIRIRKTKQNFENFIYVVCYFDTVLSGGTYYQYIGSKDVCLIKGLIDHTLGKVTSIKYNHYVYSTFQCFLSNKQQIVLNIPNLYFAKNEITNLFMYELEASDNKKKRGKDFANLFRKEMFQLFKNVKMIIFMTTTLEGKHCHTVSLCALLFLIQVTSVEQVILKAAVDEDKNSWLSLLWRSLSKKIKIKYKAKGFNITLKRIQNSYKMEEDWIEIQKM